MAKATSITVAYGDGIGPEIMEATLDILKEAGAKLAIETIEVGEKVYTQGYSSGIPPKAWESLRRTGILLKSPITTPQGGGYKSLNVTIRKTLGLYANIRPCVSYSPIIPSMHDKMDLVIVRENEEDLYAGIEYRPTANSYEAVKLITRAGSEKIIRYAFEYARLNGRKKVTCMVKDNIMKMCDGAFAEIFATVSKEYPEINTEKYIVDIGSARIASRPEVFDVIVTENLYGDIISDIAAEVSGSVGLAGSCNIGNGFAMFEAIHGSAPDISGKNIANPSGLLHGALMMLVHIGQPEVAENIHNAWLKTIEDGIHTADIYTPEISKEKVGTAEFAKAVISRLGKKPKKFKAVEYKKGEFKPIKIDIHPLSIEAEKQLVGADIFVQWKNGDADELAKALKTCDTINLKLRYLSVRGLKVWPDDELHNTKADLWCCRFLKGNDRPGHSEIVGILSSMREKGIDFVQVNNLYEYEGVRGYSLPQGE